MDDRDKNVPPRYSFTTQFSIYLIFLVINDLHRRFYIYKLPNSHQLLLNYFQRQLMSFPRTFLAFKILKARKKSIIISVKHIVNTIIFDLQHNECKLQPIFLWPL